LQVSAGFVLVTLLVGYSQQTALLAVGQAIYMGQHASDCLRHPVTIGCQATMKHFWVWRRGCCRGLIILITGWGQMHGCNTALCECLTLMVLLWVLELLIGPHSLAYGMIVQSTCQLNAGCSDCAVCHWNSSLVLVHLLTAFAVSCDCPKMCAAGAHTSVCA
jgi:hypothetical protein